jgi:hypothetical protein
MIFERTVLIERVKAEIERRQQAATERSAQAKLDYDHDRSAYIENTADAWNAFANLIKRRCRSGAPVTHKDIPISLGGGRQNGWSNTGGWLRTWTEKSPSDEVADVAALTTLLALLEASLTDKVSTTELERMGFKMAQLFRVR